ncbi:serine/threonine-protein kinase [Streptomyces umbrinus]|uniref:serine/threonine-protein kinase n=1 Tax=Streptomyces umbrinus TaxID=67370 RepID=UPI00167E502C|nr:serine/threonine-protein kinase [Streptomyces umbrinus]MCR3732013.1 serine/threonine-protein kinase [Streptomyces umbrinus]
MDTSKLIGGRFRPKEPRNSGAMGDVWTAEDTKLGRTVALKFLARRRLTQQGALTEFTEWTVRMFERESLAMARVNHPNVAHIYDTGEQDGEFYIVMEYVKGRSLAEHLRTGPTLTLERTVRWTGQICEGLGAAHIAEVIHRDIKPGNIMITHQGDVKIVDFGLAFLADVTQSHTSAGTPLYKAPERWNDEQGSQRSDLYSVGCVLYEMLTGRPPFGSPQDDPMTVGRMHQDDAPAPPSAHRPGVPAQLDSIVQTLLAKDPAQRPKSAHAVAQAVSKVQSVLDASALDDATRRADVPETHSSDAGLSGRIQALDRRIFDLELRFGPNDQSVIEARDEHAELTGRSGDRRGAAALYDQLGHDCQGFFGPYDVRALNAFEGVARWIARSGAN